MELSVKNVGGTVSNSPLRREWAVGPDGGSPEPTWNIIPHYAGPENGMASIWAPINSLIGVFLEAGAPDTSGVPEPIDFTSASRRDYTTLTPVLRQPFFIGNGLTSSGVQQKITVPQGATRLFLGTMDGGNWTDNAGSFTASVCGT